MGNIDTNTLKKIGIFSFLIFPICHGIINRFSDLDPEEDEEIYSQFNILTFIIIITDIIYRLAFPIFSFYFLELIQNTQNRTKHAILLLSSAIISEIPYNFVVKETYIEKKLNNSLFDLFISYVMIWFYSIFSIKYQNFSKISNLKLFLRILMASIIFTFTISYAFEIEKYAIFIIIILANFFVYKRFNSLDEFSSDLIVFSVGTFVAKILKTQYGCYGVAAVSLMYLFRNDLAKAMFAECVVLFFGNSIDFASFLSVFLIANYNGWKSTKHACWFYALYPLYLVLWAFIFSVIGIGDPFSFEELIESFNE